MIRNIDPQIFNITPDAYQANAAYISMLREHKRGSQTRLNDLRAEINRLHAANHYMCQLIQIIKTSPSLIEEWYSLLATLSLECPTWLESSIHG